MNELIEALNTAGHVVLIVAGIGLTIIFLIS